jgi:hypothetical protein
VQNRNSSPGAIVPAEETGRASVFSAEETDWPGFYQPVLNSGKRLAGSKCTDRTVAVETEGLVEKGMVGAKWPPLWSKERPPMEFSAPSQR